MAELTLEKRALNLSSAICAYVLYSTRSEAHFVGVVGWEVCIILNKSVVNSRKAAGDHQAREKGRVN